MQGYLVLWEGLACWDGRREEAQGEGEICVMMADLHCCTAKPTEEYCKQFSSNKKIKGNQISQKNSHILRKIILQYTHGLLSPLQGGISFKF